MKSIDTFCIVLVTAPNRAVARTLANQVLQARLAACVNMVPSVESHYWWKGKLERSDEMMLIIKTKRRHLKQLERCVTEHHPYEVPEFLVVPILGGAMPYLRWMDDVIRAKS